MENKIDLLSIGDASMDVFLAPSEVETFCSINKKDCVVSFAYGDKIPVKHMQWSVGGNAANNAVGSRRLGVNVGLLLTLGDDIVGNEIIQSLKVENIDLSMVIQQPSTTSNFSTAITYGGERTIFTYHAPRSYEFPVQLPSVPWIYLTSMGESFRPFYNHLADYMAKHPEVKLAYNPGSRQLRAGMEGIGDILKLTYLIFVNREEAEKLTSMGDSHGKERDLITNLSKIGPKVCVITDGQNGAYVYDGTNYLHCNVFPMDAYERTGAGDAFGSGFLSAVIEGKTINDALIWGTVNSASVIAYVGAQKGLLHSNEMQEWVDRAKSSGVVVTTF